MNYPHNLPLLVLPPGCHLPTLPFLSPVKFTFTKLTDERVISLFHIQEIQEIVLLVNLEEPYHIIKITQGNIGKMRLYHLIGDRRDYAIIKEIVLALDPKFDEELSGMII